MERAVSEPCIDQVPKDDPRIPLIVDMVANAYAHRLPFRDAAAEVSTSVSGPE